MKNSLLLMVMTMSHQGSLIQKHQDGTQSNCWSFNRGCQEKGLTRPTKTLFTTAEKYVISHHSLHLPPETLTLSFDYHKLTI